MKIKAVYAAEAAAIRSRFPRKVLRFSEHEIRRLLDRATAHAYATMPFTVMNARGLYAARRWLATHPAGVALCSRTYPEHNTIVYWFEAR